MLLLALAGCSASDAGDASVDGKLSNNGLQLAPATLRALGTAPLGEWADAGEAHALPEVATRIAQAPGAEEHLRYLALCALDEGSSLAVPWDAGSIAYPGLFGLAPRWVEEGCDEDCQRWTTACLMAHANAAGEFVAISMRGPHTGMTWGPGVEELFPLQEAAFYGNVFQDDTVTALPALYACFGRALETAGADYLERRICSVSGACGAIVSGPCYHPDMRVRPCDGDAGDAGFYADCHVTTAAQFPADGPLYPEVVTTYLSVE